jgi:hypothetical protein
MGAQMRYAVLNAVRTARQAVEARLLEAIQDAVQERLSLAPAVKEEA